MHHFGQIHLHTALVIALIAGCGDDTDAGTDAGDDTPTDAGTTAPAESTSTGMPSTTMPTAGSTDTGSSDADISTSVADTSTTADSTGGPPLACAAPPPATDPCLTCGWEQCGDPYVACCELTDFGEDGAATEGCLPLVSCALATGCMHASCYEPQTCMAEIDAAGGITGDGTAAAGAFGDCLSAAVADGSTDACAQCQALGG